MQGGKFLPGVHETVYPRFKSNVSQRDLIRVYSPTSDEIAFVERVTRGDISKLCFLVTLKSFQRLGYFVMLSDVPQPVIIHIARVTNINFTPEELEKYDKSRTRKYHIPVIREYLEVKPYGKDARHVIVQTIGKAVKTKEDTSDLINVSI